MLVESFQVERMSNPLMNLINFLFPPRISTERVDRIMDETRETTRSSHELADKLEKVSRKAERERIDPLSELVRSVRASTLRRH